MELSFVSFDIEASNLSWRYCTINQLAACKVINGVKVAEFNEKNLRGQHAIETLFRFSSFISGFDLVAHNAVFDVGVMREKFKHYLKTPLTNDYWCTKQLTRKHYKGLQSYDLQQVANFFKVPNILHHDALNDARVCGDIFLSLVGQPHACQEQPQVSSIHEVLSIMNSERPPKPKMTKEERAANRKFWRKKKRT